MSESNLTAIHPIIVEIFNLKSKMSASCCDISVWTISQHVKIFYHKSTFLTLPLSSAEGKC